MQKVKVTRYVTGQRPIYAGESSSEEEEEDDLLLQRRAAEMQALAASHTTMEEPHVVCDCVCMCVCVRAGVHVWCMVCLHES